MDADASNGRGDAEMPDQICPQKELQARFQAREKEVAAICQKPWLYLSEAIQFLVAQTGTHGPRLAAMMTGPAWGFFDHHHSLRTTYPDEAIPYFNLARETCSIQESKLMTWLSNGEITAEAQDYISIPVSTWTREHITRQNLWDSSVGNFRNILIRTKDLKLILERAEQPEPEPIPVETKEPEPEPISFETKQPDPLSGDNRSPVRRGRPPKIDWRAVQRKYYELMDHHGAFSPDDPKWNAEARLIEELLLFIEGDQKADISVSTLKAYVKKWRLE